jgi:putative methyltransferase (TIGR04325 family)
LRRLIHALAPPLFLDLYRAARTYLGVGRHFEGHHSRFQDAESLGAPFGNAWICDAVEETRTALQSTQGIDASRYSLFPFMVSVLAHRRARPLVVMDYGGGPGIAYARALKSAHNLENVEHYVIEMEWAIRHGREMFAGIPAIHFCESIPENVENIDILLIEGVLQHMENYRPEIARLCKLEPKFILVVDLFAGSFQTFAATWNLDGGAKTPHWFFNRDEIVDLLKELGYVLLFSAEDDNLGPIKVVADSAHDNLRRYTLLFGSDHQ